MNHSLWARGPMLVTCALVLILALMHSPSQPSPAIPALPVMGSVGLGILVGGVVIGALIYLWKRPK